MNPIDPRQFRNALGAFTTGVTVVTTRDAQGQDVGLTANSFSSVSLDPPMVLWSLAKNSNSLPAFMGSDHFAVHILSTRQQPMSDRFAKRGADKFGGLDIARGHGEVPLLNDCAARFECRMAYRYEGGDHMIFVGEVLKFEHFNLPSLVYQSGGYALAVKKPAEYAAEDASYSSESFGRNALTYLLGRVYHQMRFQLKAFLDERELDDVGHQVLGILGIRDGRSIGELDAMVRVTGPRVDLESLASLEGRGFVKIEGQGAGAIVHLTDSGRDLSIEIVAATKSIEDDALEVFDPTEVQVMTHLVRRLARRTSVETPPLWKKAD